MIQSRDRATIILFDGVCNLCNAFVNFVIDRDPRAHFRFAALQSAAGQSVLRQYGEPDEGLRALVVIEEGRVYTESTAALRILRRLSGPWPLLHSLRVIPAPLRDPIYRVIARNRYRWFGRRDQCRIPEPGLERRFLS